MTPESPPELPQATPAEQEHPQEDRLYAWRRLAGWLTYSSLDKLYSEHSDITVVDMCSAFPVYAEMTRDYFKRLAIHKGERTAGRFFVDMQDHNVISGLLTIEELAELDQISLFVRPELSPQEVAVFKNLRDTVVPNKNSDFRKLVSSVIADLITRQADELPDDATLEEMLRHRAQYYKVEDQEISKNDDKQPQENNIAGGRIRTTFAIDTGNITPESEIDNNLRDLRIAAHLGGDKGELAQQYRRRAKDLFFRCLVEFTKKHIQDYRRYYSVISVDLEEPEYLKNQARRSFSQDTLKTNLFQRASRMGQAGSHIRADAYRPSFKPESIDFFVFIEGWPFYHRDLDPDKFTSWLAEEKQAGEQIYTAMRPGGEAVFFPWQSYDGIDNHLGVLLKQWQKLGAEVVIEDVSREKILEMAAKDENPHLTRHSPIFGDPDQETFQVLRLHKPQLAANIPS